MYKDEGNVMVKVCAKEKQELFLILMAFIFYFLRNKHPRYMKCLFTNIQEQQNMFKSCTLLRKIQISRVNNSRILRIEEAKFPGYGFYMNHKTW